MSTTNIGLNDLNHTIIWNHHDKWSSNSLNFFHFFFLASFWIMWWTHVTRLSHAFLALILSTHKKVWEEKRARKNRVLKPPTAATHICSSWAYFLFLKCSVKFILNVIKYAESTVIRVLIHKFNVVIKWNAVDQKKRSYFWAVASASMRQITTTHCLTLPHQKTQLFHSVCANSNRRVTKRSSQFTFFS